MTRTMGSMLEVARIQSEINRLFDNLLELEHADEQDSRTWIPNADIIEGPEQYVVRVEVPGVPLESLTVAVDGGNLIIRGVRNRVMDDESVIREHARERAYGGFQRVISLNAPINTHRAVATLADGVLKLTFPKVDNRRGGEVRIPVSEN